MPELKYKDITEKIIGASFEVHKFLGNGIQEVFYQGALARELAKAGLFFDREIEQYIYYKELPGPIGAGRADFVVEEKVLVVHPAQVLNYLKAYKLEGGRLINFSSKSLTIKRFVL